jgi:hypothetical protein
LENCVLVLGVAVETVRVAPCATVTARVGAEELA